jgi:pimeloyl-ACP methyl ester carboxylesterase
MAKFLVCHGAWSSAWAWKKMRPLLFAAGHELHTPTYTGLGERSHLASPSVDLELHIRDVLAVIEYEDLSGLTLIGHSYGGMVATGVADRASDRVEAIVYLDAFVPGDGQSVFDLHTERSRDRMREAAATTGDGWKIPPNPAPPDTSAEDLAWLTPRRVPQPIGTFQQPLRLMGHSEPPARTYIYCTRVPPGDTFGPFAMLARNDPRWRYVELDASHSPHVTAPQALARVLEEIVTAP